MKEKYPQIKNIKNMVVPKTNAEVYELMSKGHQIVDAGVQRTQHLQLAALGSLLRILDLIANDNGGTAEDHLQAITDATRALTMGFTGLHQVRKEVIRNCLGWPLAKLCDWATEVGTENIFPELGKKLAEKDTTRAKLGNNKNKK